MPAHVNAVLNNKVRSISSVLLNLKGEDHENRKKASRLFIGARAFINVAFRLGIV